MKLEYSKAFLDAYRGLTEQLRKQTDKKLVLLANDPHHPSLHTHKRRGEEGVWQARVTSSYRLYFTMEGGTITLQVITPHEK